jgi:hypothetical protein
MARLRPLDEDRTLACPRRQEAARRGVLLAGLEWTGLCLSACAAAGVTTGYGRRGGISCGPSSRGPASRPARLLFDQSRSPFGTDSSIRFENYCRAPDVSSAHRRGSITSQANPAGRQSNFIWPLAPWIMLVITLVPKPFRFGRDTAGPPVSVQRRTSRPFSGGAQETSIRPLLRDRAPYLPALVASS